MGIARKQKVTKLNSNYINEQAVHEKYKQKKRRFVIRRLMGMGICAGIIAVMICSTLISQHSFMEKQVIEKKQLTEQLAELKDKEEGLRSNILKLNDDEYIAKIARSEYFLSEEGEVIFKVVE